MNDKIKELAISAKLSYVMTPDKPYIEEDLFNFASLIMKECAEACSSASCGRENSATYLIERHFGVTL